MKLMYYQFGFGCKLNTYVSWEWRLSYQPHLLQILPWSIKLIQILFMVLNVVFWKQKAEEP